MNSIGPVLSQAGAPLAGATNPALGAAVAHEEKGPVPAGDGVTLSGAGAVAENAGVAASLGVADLASQGASVATKAAAAVIGGPVGHALGVTASDLKECQREIEKGYHLPDNYISGYFDRRILPYQDRPRYSETDGQFYRGMYITVDELANILQNGFEVKYNTWSAVGGKGIYVSTSEREAEDYIFQAVDPSKKNAIGVVFKMERGDYAGLVEDPHCNPTNTIYKAPGDVPSEKIVGVYVKGQYGLESLESIIEKARKGEVNPNTAWVNQFDGLYGR